MSKQSSLQSGLALLLCDVKPRNAHMASAVLNALRSALRCSEKRAALIQILSISSTEIDQLQEFINQQVDLPERINNNQKNS